MHRCLGHWAVGIFALGVAWGCAKPQKGQMQERPEWEGEGVQPSLNGIEYPKKHKYWPVLSVGHRVDKQTLHLVVGNATAARAVRDGQTNPWPQGTVLGHVVWQQGKRASQPTMVTTRDFLKSEFMFKDVEKYAENNSGWAWARWEGEELRPYGEDESFDTECIACHQKASDRDWVFTYPSKRP